MPQLSVDLAVDRAYAGITAFNNRPYLRNSYTACTRLSSSIGASHPSHSLALGLICQLLQLNKVINHRVLDYHGNQERCSLQKQHEALGD
jgi:hypothetical protein